MDDQNSESSSTAHRPSPEHMPCPVCGRPVSLDQKFCGHCGTRLRKSCSVCGSENPIYHRFCGVCGAQLDQPLTPPLEKNFEITNAHLSDERRWATALFADITGFTSLSERMDPEDVKALAERCAQLISSEVQRFGGTVLRMIGDEIFAVFGAPVAYEDDTERAVRAGIAIRDLDISTDQGEPINVHVGINTGEVIAGVVDPQGLREYTIHGDTVNTAARIRNAAPPGSVLVGEQTYQETYEAVNYRSVPPITAKGKYQPVGVWEAIGVIAAPRARPLGTAPFIGREDELERLENMWRRVAHQLQPHMVTIIGEPGIGKSRLVAEFERLLPSEVITLHGRCLPYGDALGYWSLAIILKEAAKISPDDDNETARAKLSNRVSSVMQVEDDPGELARHLALMTGMDMEADRSANSPDQRVLHTSVRRFLEAFARRHPLCLICDDIHWADDIFLDLIEFVAARARQVPLLIITEARPELLEKRETWGKGVRSFTSLVLSPLSKNQEHELVLALLKEHGLPDSLADKVSNSVSGNPLFAEELVAMIAEGGEARGIPSLLKMLIAARLDSLQWGMRKTIQFASVFGKTFWEAGLLALGSSEDYDLDDYLEALEIKDLVRRLPQSQLRGQREFVFKHDLIRDVAYEMLPRAERRKLHRRVVDWFEGSAGDQLEAYLDHLAHHALEAGQHLRSIGYLQRAAERAAHTGAHRQDAALLTQAISIAERIEDVALITALRAQRGMAYKNVWMWEEAEPDLEAALAGTPPEDRERRAELLLDVAEVHLWSFDIVKARRLSNDGLSLAEELGREDLVMTGLSQLSHAESSDGNLRSSLDLNMRIMRIAERSDSIRSSAPLQEGMIYYWLGHPKEAIDHTRYAIEKTRGNTSATMFLLPHLGMSLASSGRYEEAVQVFDETRQYGTEYEVWPLLARAIAMSAGFHLDVYDYIGNENLAEEARQLAISVDFKPTIVSTGIDLLLNFARRSEVGRAERLLPEVVEKAENASGFHGWLWRLRLAEARAEIVLARKDWEEALHLAEEAISQSRARGRVKYHILGLQTRARALTALGRTSEAIDALKKATKLARSTSDPARFFQAASASLSLEEDETLAEEALAIALKIRAALPDNEMRNRFENAEPVRRLFKMLPENGLMSLQ